MRAHGTGVPTEPIFYDAQTRQIVSDYIRLRYQMLPYNYTLAWQNTVSGMPLARPVFFEGDEGTTNLFDEYLWGDAFLVAPVLQEGQTERSVYFPSGMWIDFWNDGAHQGGMSHAVSAPLDRLPLFVRAASLIPMAPAVETTQDYATDTLLLHYYPEPVIPTSGREMYEDDGEAPDAYEVGQYQRLLFAAFCNSTRSDVTCMFHGETYPGGPNVRRCILVTHRISLPPDSVLYNDLRLPFLPDSATFAAADSGVWWSAATQRLYASFHWFNDNSTIHTYGLHILDAESRPAMPERLELHAAYPNPFNSSTTISFSLPVAEHITLSVFDLQGRVVRTLADSRQSAGIHRVTFDGEDLASGLYFCRLTTSHTRATQKLILLR